MKKEHPVIGTLIGVGVNAAASYTTPLSYLDAFIASLSGKTYDPNSSMNIGTMVTGATQEGLTGDIKSSLGKFMADIGISTAQYLSKLPLGPAAALSVMASGAAGQTAYEAKQNGADTESALMLGTIAGVTEAVTEKIPLDDIAAAFAGKVSKTAAAQKLKQLFKVNLNPVLADILKTAGEEGAEELISEYVNNIANQVIRGDESDYSQLVNGFISQGMSKAEAERKAISQYYIMNPALAFLGGAISGGGMSALGHAVNNPAAIAKAITGDSYIMKYKESGFFNKSAESAKRISYKKKGVKKSAGQNGAENLKERSPMYSFKNIKIPSYEELVNKPDMKVVDIRSDRDERPFKEQRKDFMQSDIANELYKNPVINHDTGEMVFITPKTFEHSLSGNGYDKINSAKNIRSIIENAVLTHSENPTHGANNTTGVYTLFAAARTNAGIVPVKVKIKEYIIGKERLPATISEYFDSHKKNSEFYSSVYDNRVLEVESIEKESASSLATAAQSTSGLSASDPSTLPLSAMQMKNVSSSALSGTGSNPVLGEYPSTSSTISIAQLLSLVNSEYKKYLPNDKIKSNDAAQASYAPTKIDSSSITDSESNVHELQFIRQSAGNMLSNVTSVFDKPAVGAEAYTQIRASSAKNDTVRTGFASGAKQADVETAELVAKAFGRNIIFKSDNYQINGKFADGTIYVNPDGSDLVSTTIAHELTHSIEGADGYDEIKAAIKQLVSDRGGDWNALLSEVYYDYSDFYKKQGRELTKAEVGSEATARVVSSMFSDRASLETFARNNRNVVVRMWNRLKSAVVCFSREIKAAFMNDSSSRSESRTAARAKLLLNDMERLRDMFADVLVKIKGTNSISQTSKGSDSQYSIKYDDSNTPYVEVDKDVLAGVPQNQWVSTIKQYIPNISSVIVGNENININRTTKKEYLNSKYSQYISRNNSSVYKDKLNALQNIDEIIKATHNYVNESLNHTRKDNIIQFSRGEVNLRVGNNEYKANAVYGYSSNGNTYFYDIINLQPTVINKKPNHSIPKNGYNNQPQKKGSNSTINSISNSAANVNKQNVNNNNTPHSYEQYGTKPINEVEAILRNKALELQQRGYDQVEIYDKTGWFWDRAGNLKVNHEANIYLYGSNGLESMETGDVVKLRSELDSVKAGFKKELEKATAKVRLDTTEELTKKFKNEFKRSAEYKPSRDFVKSLVKEVMGDDFSNKYRSEIVDRVLKVYDSASEVDLNDSENYLKFTRELSDIVNDIQASHSVVNEDNAELVKRLKPELREPIYVTENARNDFYGKWNEVKKQYFGKLRLTSDRSKGVPLDMRYMELSEAYPDWFPEDIINEGEQLRRILEVYDTITQPEFVRDSYYNFDHGDGAANSDYVDMLTKLADGFKKMQDMPRTWYDKVMRDFEKHDRAKDEEFKAKLDEVEAEAKAEAERQANEYAQKLYDIQKAADDKKAAAEERKRQRGAYIDTDKIRQSLQDNTFVQKMEQLYAKKKELSNKVAKYDKIDLNNIKSKSLREEIIQCRQELDNISVYIRRVGNVMKAQKRADWLKKINTVGDITKWTDKNAGILYSRETGRRNIRDISHGDELGQVIETDIFDKFEHDTAMETKFINTYRDKVAELGLGTKKTGRNKISESEFVQRYGEAKDNIYMLENERGYSRRGEHGSERDGLTLADWQGELNNLIAENPDMDMAKINKAVDEFKNIYDDLFKMVNHVRIMNGYEPFDYHHGYFPHFNGADQGESVVANILNGLGIGVADNGLPTTINGLTHTFRPGIRYMANSKQRVGKGTDNCIGAVEGFDRYIEVAADVIFLTEDIQNQRALSDAIRYFTSDEGTQKAYKEADERYKNNEISEQERDAVIAKLYDENHHYVLRNFVVWFEEWTNLNANKKSIKDRQWEQACGRKMYTIVKKLESRVAANMVALNIGSALTNFVPLAEAGAVINPVAMTKAIGETIAAKFGRNSDFWLRSDFLVNRRGTEKLVRSTGDKISKKLSFLMEAIDGLVSESIVRARYEQNLKRGLNDADALHEADVFTEGLMAGRSKGAMPTIFYQSNPITKLFTQFQLEVNNQFSYMLKDLPREAKDNLAKTIGMLFALMMYSWIFNEGYEKVVGRRCAFDPLDMLNNLAGDISGYHIPGLADIIECAGGDKQWSNIAKTDKQKLPTALKNFAGDAAGELPFVGGLLGGGRLPINSALPDVGNIVDVLDFSGYGKIDEQYNSIIDEKYSDGSDESNAKAEELRAEANEKKGNLTKSKLTTVGKELAKPLTYVLPPFGGGQIKKTAEGIAGLVNGGSYTYDSSGNKKLQYPINSSAGDIVAAALFGKTATRGGREWVESGFKSQSAKATEAYETLVRAGVGQNEALETVKSVQSVNGRVNKVAVLRGIDISDEAKADVFRQLVNSDYEDKLERVSKAKISFDDFLSAYEVYLSKGFGDSVERRDSVEETINGLKLANDQKDVLLGLFYKAGIPLAPWNDPLGTKLRLSMPAMPEIKLPEISIKG